MPADVVRPFASTTVHDIAVIARRLGLHWKEFSPVTGVLIAEGNGQTITSTLLRSVGVLVHYADNRVRQRASLESAIPSRNADLQGLGLICSSLRHAYFAYSVGTFEQLSHLFPAKHYSRGDTSLEDTVFGECFSVKSKEAPGLVELLSLKAHWLRLPQSSLVRLPRPFPSGLQLDLYSDTMTIFRERLGAYIDSLPKHLVSDHVRWVRTTFDSLAKDFIWWIRQGLPSESPLFSANLADKHGLEFYDRLEAAHQITTTYFDQLHFSLGQSADSYNVYTGLMERHIVGCVAAYRAAQKKVLDRHSILKDQPDPEAAVRGEAMRLLFPTNGNTWILNHGMLEIKINDEHKLIEAWLMMVMRGFCWWRCHRIDEDGPTLPPQYIDSKMPVYIG